MKSLDRQSISHQRSILRKAMRQKRLALDATSRKISEQCIVKQLIEHPILKKSDKIAVYLPMDGEVNITFWFTQAWVQSKKLYLPKIVKDQLIFYQYDKSTPIVPNQWGILEPQIESFILPQKLEVVITPLVAFDAKGNRLGRGAGYYDRAFSFLKEDSSLKTPYLIGLGYRFQETHELIPCEWDVPLHTVITEKNEC